jgi:hypothetical protein
MKKQRNNLSLSFINLILLICLVGLTGCNPSPDFQVLPQSFTPEDSIPFTQEIPIETISVPPGEYYTPRGIFPDNPLSVHKDPSINSPIVGVIPIGVTQISISDSLVQDEITWVQINYGEYYGWVDLNHLAVYQGELPQELIILGYLSLIALKDNDFQTIDELIHPNLCLRLSPYPYLVDSNQVICPGEFKDLKESDELLTWGNYDGTGDPIKITFSEYYGQFVYDSEYIQAPMIGFNIEISSGNAINNIPEIYPDGKMIEYHFPGFDPKYGGMDWRSLRLVFLKDMDTWYLAAIIHGEWTI